MVPPFAVPPRCQAVRLSTRYIQGRLFFVPLHGASMVRASALCAPHTTGTHARGSFVFDGSANGMHSARLERLTCRTAVKIVHRIIRKGFIAKDAFLASKLRFAQRISHVGGNPPRLTRDIVFTRAILVIG